MLRDAIRVTREMAGPGESGEAENRLVAAGRAGGGAVMRGGDGGLQERGAVTAAQHVRAPNAADRGARVSVGTCELSHLNTAVT